MKILMKGLCNIGVVTVYLSGGIFLMGMLLTLHYGNLIAGIPLIVVGVVGTVIIGYGSARM
ncbi:unnamed protein product [marine sediment metagenome]|uniref:Uncharacterized protein n=1 Tax=marine sediment metagenome TaxID=412755 RepID=X1MYK9_9ZZZZ